MSIFSLVHLEEYFLLQVDVLLGDDLRLRESDGVPEPVGEPVTIGVLLAICS